MSYFRRHIDEMTAYVPGEQPADAGTVIKLNTNESPYPPSPMATAALTEISPGVLRIYPDPASRRVCAAMADLLDCAGRLGPRDERVGQRDHDDRPCGRRAGRCSLRRRSRSTNRRPTSRTRPSSRSPTATTSRCPLTGSPRPTGPSRSSPTRTARPARRRASRRSTTLAGRLQGLLVIDEAYVDFATDNAARLVARHDNVILLRTLSKGYSLAGLRLGFIVARPALLAGALEGQGDLRSSGPSRRAVGLAALRDQAHKIANARRILASRKTLAAELREAGWTVLAERGELRDGPPAGG